ncbi:hypothetical protein [Paraeggerthella sp.]|uniref:hypothetical protein n=1 Tax=Paraeggerthella sp. TaxID=2897350 RepID=UPI00215D8D10
MAYESGHYKPVDNETAEKLEKKCQENGWLMRGGYDWQDDPYLEEYPYEFCTASDMESLTSFFEHGNWAIRQGIVFDDLAFIQQVNGGDEWWTLKRDGDGWVDFESVSCEHIIAHSRSDFERLIASMRAASTDECVRLDYLFPNQLADKLVELSEEFGHCKIADDHESPENFRAYVVDALASDPEAATEHFNETVLDDGVPAAKALAIEIRMQMAAKGDSLAERAFASREASNELDSKNTSMPPTGKEH